MHLAIPSREARRKIKLQNKFKEKPNKALSKADNKSSFSIRNGRLKIFQGDKVSNEDNTEEVHHASQLLGDVVIIEQLDGQEA